jgi:hypothetical protein
VDEDASPLTAGIRYGLGRSAVVMTDPLGAWAPGWADLGVLPALAARATRPALRAGPRLEAEFDGPRLRLAVHTAVDAPSLSASLTLPDGSRRSLRLEAAGASRYETEIPDPPAGAARIRVETDAGILDGGFPVPWPSEFAASGPDPAALDALRAVVESDGPPPAATVTARELPALLALLLLLLDRLILARKGGLGLKRTRPRSR